MSSLLEGGLFSLTDEPQTAVPSKGRARHRENAIKSEASWIKHDLIRRSAGGQAAAFRAKHSGRVLLIDGNAGDGQGVEKLQRDLFGPNPSCSTSELLVRLAADIGNADVVLCEAQADRRALLEKRFPEAVVLPDHADAVSFVCANHRFALWVSDPCGPSDHGIVHMRAVADRIRSDFIIVFNEGAVANRIAHTRDRDPLLAATPGQARAWKANNTSRARYLPMLRPDWWLHQLGRRRIARTGVVKASEAFCYRVLVVSNFLTAAAHRHPFEVVV